MENLIESTIENYGIYINGLWNIPYAIQLFFNIVMEGFIIGLMLGWWTTQIHSELDYSSLGFYFMGS